MHVIKLNSTIGILLPSCSREIKSGGLVACQSNPPPKGVGGLQHVNPTHLRMEPSCTTTSTKRAEVWIAAAFILGPQALRF
jgi:hypothetical protein